MSLDLDKIRATADRVAASHSLEVVDVEFSGGVKFRTLRVFIEKNAEARRKLAELAANAEAGAALDPAEPLPILPAGVAPEQLSGTTHEDCTQFAEDFGTVIDVEDLVPGSEYTLEVSSPGLERKLTTPADFTRFLNSLAKLRLFQPIGEGQGNRHFEGRMTAFDGITLTLDPSAMKQKTKGRKAAASPPILIAFANIEKANLIPEI